MTTATVPTENSSRWKKGIPSPNPNGRPKGSLTKYHKFQAAMATSGLSPMEFLLAIVRCDKQALDAINVPIEQVDLALRKSCAIELMPYCHRRQPQAMAVATYEMNPTEAAAMSAAMSMLSDDEFEVASRAIRRAQEIKTALVFEAAPTEQQTADAEAEE